MSLVRTPKETAENIIPPGTYHVVCMDVRPDHLENSQYGTGDVIRFDLEVVDQVGSDGNPLAFDAIANDRLTPKSKLWGWLEAFGVKVEKDVECDIEQVVGMEAMVRLVKKENSDFSKVDSIIPLPSKGVKSPAKASGEPDFDAFWKRVRAAGFDRKEVAPFVNNDLGNIVQMSGDELDGILKEMGI